jgi:hypothetical protein
MDAEPRNGSQQCGALSASLPAASIGGRITAYALFLLVPVRGSCKGSPRI